jgi:DNA-binding transcriptional MocR family regulator
MKTLANLLNLRLEPVPIDREGLIPEAFEAACRKSNPRALYCIPTLHNPTNATLPDGRRRRIAAIARSYGVAVVEDDIHGLLPAETPRPIGHYVPELSYYIASLSKTVAGGLRVAFLIAPEHAVEPIAQAVGATVWLASPITTEIAATWISDGTADRTLAGKRREATARQRIARALLGRFGLRSHPASYHAWIELPPPWRTNAFVETARRCGVVIAPADLFAVGHDAAPNAVRISLSAAPNRDLLTHALTAIASLLARSPAPGRAVV